MTQIVPIFVAALLATSNPGEPARDRMLVFSGRDDTVPQSLLDAIKIQLFDLVEIESDEALTQTPLAGRVREGITRAKAKNARFGLWIETATISDAPQRVLYLADAQQGGLVAALPVAGEGGGEVERALALKVREAVESSPKNVETATSSVARPGSEITAEAEIPDDEPGHAFFDLTGLVLAAPHPAQIGVGLGAGGSFEAGPIRLEPRIGAALMGDITEEGEQGRVSISEWDLLGGLRAVLATRAIGLGAGLELGGRHLSATGVSSAGSDGQTSRWVPWLGLGAEARAPLTERVQLRFSLGGELMLKSQVFAVNQVAVLDVGRWRLKADLGLVVHFL